MSGAGPAKGVLTIGEVIGRLAPDFPDLTVSKIRYLESGGLISPERTPAGYRRFTEEDIEKLRWVLAAQRDQYLPLKVIRQHLADGTRADGTRAEGTQTADPGAQDSAAALAIRGAAVADPEFFDAARAGAGGDNAVGELHLGREGLARTAGVPGSFVADLIGYGLLPAGEDYGGDAVFIVRAAAALTEFGLEPRHLRPLLTGARNTAGLLATSLPAKRHDGLNGPARVEAASRTAARSAQACAAAVRLYAALLRAELVAPSAPTPSAAPAGPRNPGMPQERSAR